MRVVTIVGNRPQFIKAAAVSRHLRGVHDEVLIHTGQHYDRELSDVFFEELELPAPDHILAAGDGSHADQTGRMMSALEPLVESLEPAAVLVYGDTNSTLAGALVAAKGAWPLAHVEAGMRSFDRSTPEEVNRIVADHLSDLLLCSTATASANLEREGLGDRAHVVGDVMADIALEAIPLAEQRSDVLERLGLDARSYCLATAHRAENVDDPQQLERLVALLTAAASICPVVFPVHPRTARRLRTAGLDSRLEQADVLTAEPMGYLDLARLLHGARALLTDSGGLQKEAYLAGVPCITLREATEWVETVEAGWNHVVGLDSDAAVAAIRASEDLRNGPPPSPTVYGGGQAGQHVVTALDGWLTGRPTG